ncbi:hypothetical protein K504DRAFT_264856 [Pleomassaria siparia CBS 279.74]|uniref:Uncharacterized protein n=1 Tax=Pleomassaria siparia CBS 279.74 TaxID=1314801 RepID=A0A6G1KCJ7_9PLEO|nr:hypothetical protein K504DRAFT_264856 [Pleomassaria siparia CBS 279.74]
MTPLALSRKLYRCTWCGARSPTMTTGSSRFDLQAPQSSIILGVDCVKIGCTRSHDQRIRLGKKKCACYALLRTRSRGYQGAQVCSDESAVYGCLNYLFRTVSTPGFGPSGPHGDHGDSRNCKLYTVLQPYSRMGSKSSQGKTMNRWSAIERQSAYDEFRRWRSTKVLKQAIWVDCRTTTAYTGKSEELKGGKFPRTLY